MGDIRLSKIVVDPTTLEISNGTVFISNTINSSTLTDGSFSLRGGMSLAKNLLCGDYIDFSLGTLTGNTFIKLDTNDLFQYNKSNNTFNFLIGGNSQLDINDTRILFNNTTDSSGTNSGSLQLLGGIGIAKSLYTGSNIYMAGNLVATQSYVSLGYQPLDSDLTTLATNATSGITISINSTTDSSGTNSGSLITAGGIGIAKSLYVGNTISTNNGTIAGGKVHYSLNNSSTRFAFGLNVLESGSNSGSNFELWRYDDSGTFIESIYGVVRSTGITQFYNTADSSSTNSGSLQISGGVGIAKSLYTGSNIYMNGNLVATQSYVSIGYQPLDSDLTTLATNATSGTTISINSTTDSSSTNSGSLQCLGGIASAKTIYGNKSVFGTKYYSGTTSDTGTLLNDTITIIGNPTANDTGSDIASPISILSLFRSGLENVRYSNVATFLLSSYERVSTASRTQVDLSLLHDTGGDSLVKVMSWKSNGTCLINSTTDSSNTSSGSLQCLGGVGIAKTCNTGLLYCRDTSDAYYDGGYGSLNTDGGCHIRKRLTIGTGSSPTPGLNIRLNIDWGLNISSGTNGPYLIAHDYGNSGGVYKQLNFLGDAFRIGTGVSGDTTRFTIDNSGITTFSTTTDSSGTNSGSLQCLGGVGIAKNLYLGGGLYSTHAGGMIYNKDQYGNMQFQSGATTGSYFGINNQSGNALFAIANDLNGWSKFYSTVDSSSTSTGSLQLLGGVGIAKSLYTGSNIYMNGNLVATQSYVSLGYQPLDSDLTTLSTNATSGTTLSINSTTNSSNTNSGSVILAGGMSIAKNLYIGGTILDFANGLIDSRIRFGGIQIFPNWVGDGLHYLQLGDTSRTDSSFVSLKICPLESTSAILTINSDNVTINKTTDSSSTNSGSLQCLGGAGIAKKLYVGDSITCNSTTRVNGLNISGAQPGILFTNSTSNSTNFNIWSSITTDSIGIGYLTFYDNTNNQYLMTLSRTNSYIYSTTDSTSTSSGALQIAGGLGVAKKLYVGGGIYSTSSEGMIYNYDQYGNIKFQSGALITNNWHIDNTAGSPIFTIYNDLNGLSKFYSTLDSSSTNSGSLQILGGIGIAKNCYASSFLGTFKGPLFSNLDFRSGGALPSSIGYNNLSFGFGYYDNTSGNFGDWLLLSSYADNSGHNINAISFDKDSIRMRLWQGSPGSSSPFSSYKDVVLKDTDTSLNTLTINTTTDSSGTNSGSLQCLGGAGIAKNCYIGGNINITGSLTKGSGSFDIPHPNEEKKLLGYRLRHCFVESNTRGDNLYRYQIETINKQFILELPDYFNDLNENIHVYIQSVNVFGMSKYNIDNINENIINIEVSENGIYNILVIGTRKDQIAKDFFDEKGCEYIV